MTDHPLHQLAQRFPQLCVPLSPEARGSALYKDLVLRGREHALAPAGFSCSAADELKTWQTPAGPAEVLYLDARADFERCVCALAYRCEPRSIPASMGATTVIGLIDWGRIRAHRRAYAEAGGGAWPEEFRRFTADPANYQTTLILVGSGFYSAVPPEAVGLSAEEWLSRSLTIRTYHELTHYVCRRRYPQNVDPIRDEVIADAIGLAAAFGAYDPQKAALFLGIENDTYRPGGRLENYQQAGQTLEAAIDAARAWIDQVMDALGDTDLSDPFRPIPRLMTMQHAAEA